MDCSLVRTLVHRYVSAARRGGARGAGPGDPAAAGGGGEPWGPRCGRRWLAEGAPAPPRRALPGVPRGRGRPAETFVGLHAARGWGGTFSSACRARTGTQRRESHTPEKAGTLVRVCNTTGGSRSEVWHLLFFSHESNQSDQRPGVVGFPPASTLAGDRGSGRLGGEGRAGSVLQEEGTAALVPGTGMKGGVCAQEKENCPRVVFPATVFTKGSLFPSGRRARAQV